MKYTFQVAYINTIRAKKIIPKTILQELENNKNISNLVSVLKEYKYNKIFSFTTPEVSILNRTNFEDILQTELKESLELIDSLLLPKHKWFINFFLFFLNPVEVYSTNFVSFFEHYNKLFNQLGSTLCKKLFTLIVDFENIKLFLSYITIQKSIQELVFIPYGSMDEKKFRQIFPSVENLNKYLYYSSYPKTKVSVLPQDENFNFYFNYYLEELVGQSKFFYFTIEPIIFYFFEKLIEIQELKRIYYIIKEIKAI
jgi:vacuolar-type H+-ATPase subunit C/Vma6